MTTCRSCGAAIRWATTVAGKKIPLDMPPVPDGTIYIHDDGHAVVLSKDGRTLLDMAGVTGDYYRAHWATCPQAAEWRGKP